MSDLKKEWKETGVGLGHAFRDFGKTFIKTVGVGAQTVADWANDKKPSDKNSSKCDEKADDKTDDKTDTVIVVDDDQN